MAHRFVNPKTLEATKEYLSLAKELGISPVTLAVAYSKEFDFVASTIIGARKQEQLKESFAAIDYKLNKQNIFLNLLYFFHSLFI